MFKFFVFCLIGCALGQTLNENLSQPESPAAQYLGLSAGASQVVPNIRATFSCIGRNYGYFADVDNNCQIFHVCHPSTTASGERVIYQFSQFCPKTTRFDQRRLTCVPEDDPKLTPCGQSVQYFPVTETRLNELPVQQIESVQQLPEVEQRLEQVVEEQRQELPVQNQGYNTVYQNTLIPSNNVVRSEALPQQLPEIVEQRREQSIPQSVPQLAALQNVVNQPIVSQTQPIVDVRNVEPIQQQSIPFTEQDVPVVQRSNSYAVKQEVVPLTNTQTLRTTQSEVKNNLVTPAVALRNTEPNTPVVSTPAQITRPVLVDSGATLRRTVPQTQYVAQPQTQSQPLYQPLYVQQPYIQPFVTVRQTTPRVIRPSQYSAPAPVARNTYVAQQQPIVYNRVTYQSIPQYLRTTVVQPNVIRPSGQNPVFTRI